MPGNEDQKANNFRKDTLCSPLEGCGRRIFKDATNVHEKKAVAKELGLYGPSLLKNTQNTERNYSISK